MWLLPSVHLCQCLLLDQVGSAVSENLTSINPSFHHHTVMSSLTQWKTKQKYSVKTLPRLAIGARSLLRKSFAICFLPIFRLLQNEDASGDLKSVVCLLRYLSCNTCNKPKCSWILLSFSFAQTLFTAAWHTSFSCYPPFLNHYIIM